MAVVTTVAPKEDFIVQINGDYNLPFDELTLADDAVAGEVVVVGSGFGIVAEGGKENELVRVMVRGNPTTVNAKALTGYVAGTHEAALAAVGIVVVNA